MCGRIMAHCEVVPMKCRCAELCSQYGNCLLEDVDGLQQVQPLAGPRDAGVSERYRCAECGQVWELLMIPMEGDIFPWIVKEGERPNPNTPD